MEPADEMRALFIYLFIMFLINTKSLIDSMNEYLPPMFSTANWPQQVNII